MATAAHHAEFSVSKTKLIIWALSPEFSISVIDDRNWDKNACSHLWFFHSHHSHSVTRLFCFLKINLFICPVLPTSPHQLMYDNRFIFGVSTIKLFNFNPCQMNLSISLSTLSSPYLPTPNQYLETCLVVPLSYQIIQTFFLSLLDFQYRGLS